MLTIRLLLIAPLVPFISACTPFFSNFPAGSVSSDFQSTTAPFVSITPPNSFSTVDGLSMFLKRPPGDIVQKEGINSQLAEGATINSTFMLQYGKVTFEIQVPTLVSGIVVATILIGDQSHDEIDIELLGGDSAHWQSNVYAPSPSDKQPLWGVFGEIQSLPHPPNTIASSHAYTIDWNADRIIWSIDGVPVRTLQPYQTERNGVRHFPSHPARIQLGIWDASSPVGTAQWAKGPVDWNGAPSNIHAIIKSVRVECPHA